MAKTFARNDWAGEEHAVCVLDGERLRREVLPHTLEAIAAWAAGLACDFGSRPVAVMVEQSRGALLHALMQYPQLVLFPINPKQAARYREALVHSGKKDDPTDAECLARFVREHHRQLRAWRPDDAATRQLAQLVELRRKAVESRNQTAQQGEARLKQYDPAVALPSPWSMANNAWENQNWKFDLATNMCPSSPIPTSRGESPAILSYKVCVGDDYRRNQFIYVQQGPQNNRGIFQTERWTGMQAVTDGTSQTVMMGEAVTGGAPNDVLGGVAVTMQAWDPNSCMLRINPANRRQVTNPVRADFRPTGGRALDGRPYFVGFATLIAPNGPTCHWGGVDGNEHMGTLSSFHPGGGQVSMADASIRFINQTIKPCCKLDPTRSSLLERILCSYSPACS